MNATTPSDPRPWLPLGIELLESYDPTVRTGLDEGIELVVAATEVLPLADPTVAYANALLVDAYRVRSDLDDDAEDLDRAIRTGEAVVAAVDPDHPVRVVAYDNLAVAYERRLRRDGRPTDLDAVIRCLRVVLDRAPGLDTAARYADLLRERSVFTRNPGDLDEAVTLLERLLAGGTESGADRWLAWHALGRARQREAELRGRPDRSAIALDCFDRALRSAPPTGDHLLNLHYDRLLLLRDVIMTPGPGRARVVERAPEILAEAEAAGRWVGASSSPAVRLQLAGTLAALLLLLDAGHVVPPAGWDLLGLLVDHLRDTRGTGGGADTLATWLVGALAGSELADRDRRTLRDILSELLNADASRRGDLHGQQQAGELLAAAAAGPTGPVQALAGTVHAAMQYAMRGDLDRFRELARRAERDLAALPDWPVARAWLASLVESLRLASALIGDPDGEPVDRRPPADLPDPLTPVTAHRALLDATMRYARDLVHLGPAELRAYAEFFSRLALATGFEARFVSLAQAGQVWLELARRDDPDGAAARAAVTHFEQALASAAGPDDPHWADLAIGLGESLRLVAPAHHARSRELGRSGLHGLALNVFLQAGTDHAAIPAQRGAELATRVAGWHLADRAYDELLSVLDAGRGLVLASAAASRDVEARLVAAGHPGLAAEWRATRGLGRDRYTGAPMPTGAGGAGVADDLRTRVIRALHADGPDPVSVPEVRRALRDLDADALVYLVPSGDAVLVPARGEVEAIALPGLAAGPGAIVHRWAEVSATLRDLAPQSVTSGRPDLDDVCAWAWTACVRHVVERARTWRPDRPARVVLVPMGVLGLVPWHAAFTTTGSGQRRYAVEEVAFSYTISARVLCSSARHPLRRIESALIIGDPEGNLPYAGIEAAAVHESFHPRGVHLGRSATPDRVLDWLANASGPSLLHLACHATTDRRRPADARLVLAGGTTLAARELIEACRVAALPVDRVFLAACTTNVTGDRYDEAFSLATAFLTAGAHTVFGTLWPVRDQETSLFMYMIHHYLDTAGCLPSDALHRAQRWMLDPDRRPPEGMPDRLAAHCHSDALARPAAWASVTHLGR